MTRLHYLIFILLTGLGCEKAGSKAPSTGQLVEIYGLESYQRIPNKCQLDPATAVLKASPIITSDHIISYSQGSYEFKLTTEGKQAAAAFIDWHVFAVTVDKEVIYYGFYKPMTSSSSCDHSITMNFAYPSGNLSMNLGYPSLMPGITIDDRRNHPKLLSALLAQGKLAN